MGASDNNMRYTGLWKCMQTCMCLAFSQIINGCRTLPLNVKSFEHFPPGALFAIRKMLNNA